MRKFLIIKCKKRIAGNLFRGEREENTMGKVPYFAAEVIAEKTWMITNAFTERTPAIAYLVEGEDYALVIDTMMGWGNLKAFCETLTEKPLKLACTHAHPDHTGGNFHFDSCYIGARDVGPFSASIRKSAAEVMEQAKGAALPEYKEMIEADDNFVDEHPILVYPVWDGDVFDLGGGHEIEVVEVGGHTTGTIVLIDHKTRIAFSGDACNGNTLLDLPNCLPVEHYLKALLHLKAHQEEFDMMYGGHQIFDNTIVDEGIETVARVIAGSDDHCEGINMFGLPNVRAAKTVGFERVDGKRFNMAYKPDQIMGCDPAKQIIKKDPEIAF